MLVRACDNPPTAPSGPYTLSGVVTQMTSSGRVPIRGVFVEEGCATVTTLYAWKFGYEPPSSARPCEDHGEQCSWVTIAGNTRFDFQLSR